MACMRLGLPDGKHSRQTATRHMEQMIPVRCPETRKSEPGTPESKYNC